MPLPEGTPYFHTTRWTLVLEAGSGDDDAAVTALSELCRSYWYPLYAFARRSGNSPEDSQDLTQGFFEKLLARNDISAVNREKGKFRSFLLASLKNFMANEYHKAKAQRRGGDMTILSVDEKVGEEQYSLDPGHGTTPDLLFQRSWALSLLKLVLARLGQEYEMAGRSELHSALEPFLTDPTGNGMTHAELGSKLGISQGSVSVSIHRMRRRYGELLREEVASTMPEGGDIDEEVRYLFSVLGPEA